MVLQEKFKALNAYIKKLEREQINDLVIWFRDLDKQGQNRPKSIRQQEIKVMVKINEIETKKTTHKKTSKHPRVGSLGRYRRSTDPCFN